AYEEDFQRGTLTLTCTSDIRCPSVQDLLRRNLVGQSLAIGCRDTYYREIQDLDEEGRVALPLDHFFGRVEITPLLISKAAIAKYTSTDLSKEFQQPISFDAGDLVGYAPTM